MVNILAIASPAPRGIWRDLISADPDALASQTPDWLDCIVADDRWKDASRLYELSDGARLVMPAVSRAFGSIESSLPLGWGFGGLVSDHPLTPASIAAVFDDLTARRTIRQRIRPNVIRAAAWAEAVPKGVLSLPKRAHVVSLEGGATGVWDRLHKDTRRRVRRAESLGVEVEYDGTGKNVEEFYGLLLRSIERWAEQQHEPLALARFRAMRRDPRAKFESMAAILGERLQIGIARHEGRAVASNVVLMGANAHATRAAMDKELAGPVSANSLLEWKALELACERGHRHYHMGESGNSGSIARHKESYGAVAYDYCEYFVERLPISEADALARRAVKRVLRFKD